MHNVCKVISYCVPEMKIIFKVLKLNKNNYTFIIMDYKR